MNFYKIRQRTTGEYFLGGRYAPSFGQPGMRYEALNAVTAALRHIERERPNQEKQITSYVERCALEGRAPEEPWFGNRKAAVQGLLPHNLEIVEFEECEVRIIEKK
ncbi:hypothetical protein [Hymenobacter latericus]|uniref:hypothetical protein n=1 Tax=Hymenobacter sp. YIM 151858-1 TaxID=2987688 RepID=UPI00222732B8|nr:hypothetical protein [Hymenobacter sp. YIM 151858-1]UYZ60140.1 hypothetical protein OIS50_04895 [Hymenobacter sp. YIM 151858-1]